MNLKARLTLSFVLLAVLLAGTISCVDLAGEINQQFAATLERAENLRTLASDLVGLSLNRPPTKPLGEAVRDPEVSTLLRDTMLASHAIVEIAVVSPENEILADSIPDEIGKVLLPYDDFRPVVTDNGWYGKWRMLRVKKYYQLQQALGPRNGPPILFVRVVVAPELISAEMMPRLKENGIVALFSVLGAALVTMLVSAVAFRPLGRLRRQVESMTSGENPPEATVAKAATDDLSVISSRVAQLGLQLRGAQFEVSDLRGNLGRLLRDLEDAVFLFNREGRLVFASGTVEKFTGLDAAALTGKTIAQIFSPETLLGQVIAQATAAGLSIGKRRVEVGPGDSSSSVASALLSVDPLTAPGGAGSGTLIRLRDPEAQRKLGRELQTADRLAALSRVSGGVAHEVKNPLNAILLHVEVARAKLAHGDTALEPQMDIISSEILRLDRVVKTFLDFTRPVELNLANVPLDEFVRDLVDLARPQADASRISVVDERKAGGVEVRIDRDLLKQAVLNIVVNAIEAMPAGGELRLESSASGDTAEIRVSDTGPGIPPDLREKIFRLYFTTKQKGSGIGLAMAFRIVQLHDGTIDFTSEPGKGTAFFIRLPIAA
ncbi:MAG TPA: ATP-binding protein [Bryobacteraceae bacterium]|jgi:signal transduction histidine kinase